jgi:hypothetical protein
MITSALPVLTVRAATLLERAVAAAVPPALAQVPIVLDQDNLGAACPSGPLDSVELDDAVPKVSYAKGVGSQVEVGILMLSAVKVALLLAIYG